MEILEELCLEDAGLLLDSVVKENLERGESVDNDVSQLDFPEFVHLRS